MAEVVDDSIPLTVTLQTIPDECTAGQTREKTCDDGSVIVTHTCVNGKWSATGNVCPDEPDPDCYPDETQTKTCDDGSVIVTHTCVNGKWSATGNVCPEDPDPDPEKTSELLYVVIGLVGLYLILKGR